MEYKRARVAITPVAASAVGKVIEPATHIGHARTLLLGSLIAQELNTPFHIRLDGDRESTIGTGDATYFMLDLIECINFLGIEFEKFYWHPQQMPTQAYVERCTSPLFWTALHGPNITPESYGAVMVDDIVIHYPSLVIRGAEFSESTGFFGAKPDNVSHTTTEKFLYDIACRERYEINVPLITVNGMKISKQSIQAVPWNVLTPVSQIHARKFLMATAINPDDPLSAIDKHFSVKAMTKEPYTWRWGTWFDFLKMAAN